MRLAPRAPTGLVVDPHSQVPAHAQLKEQIKFACTYQELREGDVLPSIRALARRLGVGDGVVRRAYRELCEVGLLATARRKHVVVTPALVAASESGTRARACAERCFRLMAWAVKQRVSAIALGRLLLRHALAREATSPSYVFVDICRLAAQESANKIARAWEIKVAGVAVADFAALQSADIHRLSAVLVNQHLYEDVAKLAGEGTPGVFAVRMRVGTRLQQRISRLPARSRVLVVRADESVRAADEAFLRHCAYLFGNKRPFHAKTVSELPDLAALVRARRYRLVLLCPQVWEQVPATIRRMPTVARAVAEPDPQSLEESRIAAGILL